MVSLVEYYGFGNSFGKGLDLHYIVVRNGSYSGKYWSYFIDLVALVRVQSKVKTRSMQG